MCFRYWSYLRRLLFRLKKLKYSANGYLQLDNFITALLPLKRFLYEFSSIFLITLRLACLDFLSWSLYSPSFFFPHYTSTSSPWLSILISVNIFFFLQTNHKNWNNGEIWMWPLPWNVIKKWPSKTLSKNSQLWKCVQMLPMSESFQKFWWTHWTCN